MELLSLYKSARSDMKTSLLNVDVECSVTPAEHYYGMNQPSRPNVIISITAKHIRKSAHMSHTVTKLTLYDLYGNKIVETYDYNDSPYRHTIVITDCEDPGGSPHGALQWSVSTASNQLQDFRDVDNLTTTSVVKGTPVYVQIRPVGFNNITYDRWEIEYTVTPPVTTIRWRKPFREPSVIPSTGAKPIRWSVPTCIR